MFFKKNIIQEINSYLSLHSLPEKTKKVLNFVTEEKVDQQIKALNEAIEEVKKLNDCIKKSEKKAEQYVMQAKNFLRNNDKKNATNCLKYMKLAEKEAKSFSALKNPLNKSIQTLANLMSFESENLRKAANHLYDAADAAKKSDKKINIHKLERVYNQIFNRIKKIDETVAKACTFLSLESSNAKTSVTPLLTAASKITKLPQPKEDVIKDLKAQGKRVIGQGKNATDPIVRKEALTAAREIAEKLRGLQTEKQQESAVKINQRPNMR